MSRRALQHLGGETRCGGESALADMLRAAFEAAEHEAPDALTHGFHSYPARMHFAIARTIIESVSSVGARVLDPFCGSGTVPLEAMLAGAHAHGVDLNPLALRIAAVKCQRRGLAEQDAFVQSLSAVVEASKARVRSRTPVLAPLGPQERRFYDPHVLKELAGLWAEIEAVEDARDKAALQVLFSSIVVKFSRQRADTSAELVHKRIGRFIPT